MADLLHWKPSASFLVYALLIVGLPYLLWRLPGVARTAPLGVVQILVAVLMGPAVLGAAAPGLWSVVAPPSLALFDPVGWLGLVMFAFVAGHHSDLLKTVAESRRTLGVAVFSLALPLLAGGALGFWLAPIVPGLMGPAADRVSFAAAFAICIAITALPILALILADLRLRHTPLGRMAMAAALFDDAALWIGLTAVIAATSGNGSTAGTAAVTFLLAALFAAAMLLLVRPLLARLVVRQPVSEGEALVTAFVLLAGSGLVADLIGVHFVIGAFIAGLVIPRPIGEAAMITLEPVCVHLLLPFFFISTSLKAAPVTELGTFWLVFGTATFVAMASKFIGAALPARLLGAPPGEALAVGALVQCKGLMEVVALKVLLDAGILAPACLPALLAMAILTTVVTKPLTRFILARAAVPASPAGGTAVPDQGGSALPHGGGARS